MTVTLGHRDGHETAYVDETNLDALLAELDGPGDPEHPDVSIFDESGWSLSAFPSGLVVWENVEEDEPSRHRASLTRGEVRHLFALLAYGDLKAVESVGWQSGYGP